MLAEHSVVVGVDGSESSLDAVAWAAADASRRARPLHILHAFLWPATYAPITAPMPVSAPHEESARQAGEQTLAAAEARARTVAPGIRITTATQVQSSAPALLEASRHAGVLVVGSRGHGGFAGLLLGSVGVELAAHAECPVVIVRHEERPAGPEAGRVVVGVDGSGDCDDALHFAFEQASYRGVGLTAVLVYEWPASTGPARGMWPPAADADAVREEHERALVESASGWAEKYPDVDFRPAVVSGRPGPALNNRSAGAELLVVGSRGRGAFTGMLLGSVSQTAIHYAGCPVAIVRQH
ncbi:universal stress protein [Dactylosporangium sp. NPDC049140]|uniref:universal stress protein n=1 Tax=Dactylosporangium sp. NPDC049140 TaxID=3155647 RepID=UPI0033E683ED